MAFPSVMAPDPSDPLGIAGLHPLLDKHLQREKLFCSLDLLAILRVTSSPARHGRRRHGKRSRKSSASKRALHYLKPGALAQLRDAARTAARWMPGSDFHTDQANILPGSERGERGELPGHQAQSSAMSTSNMSPAVKVPRLSKIWGPFCPQRKKLLAPRTPVRLSITAPATTPASTLTRTTDLEALPLELLVRIVCGLHHDQLKPAFHVSKRFRQAVLIARQCHFDFTTPDRDRQDESRLNAYGEIVKMAASGVLAAGLSRPTTPMAPRQAQKLLHARVLPRVDEQCLAVPLPHGHESRLHHVKPPELSRPANRGVVSHRALFYEEQLC